MVDAAGGMHVAGTRYYECMISWHNKVHLEKVGVRENCTFIDG
jgi:hypothetical protein